MSDNDKNEFLIFIRQQKNEDLWVILENAFLTDDADMYLKVRKELIRRGVISEKVQR